MVLHTVKIIPIEDNPLGVSKVLLDDKELHGVRSVSFDVGVDKVPEVTISFLGTLDIDGLGASVKLVQDI